MNRLTPKTLRYVVFALVSLGLLIATSIIYNRSIGTNLSGLRKSSKGNQASTFASGLRTIDVQPRIQPGIFTLDGSRTLTGVKLVKELRDLNVANSGQFRPILTLNQSVPLKRLLDTLDIVGEAGITQVFYTVPWSNSPVDFGGFGLNLTTKSLNPTNSTRAIILSIQDGHDDYTVDGELIVSSLAEVSWCLEDALRRRFGTGEVLPSLTVQVGPGIDPRRFHGALIGSHKLGFRQTQLSWRPQTI